MSITCADGISVLLPLTFAHTTQYAQLVHDSHPLRTFLPCSRYDCSDCGMGGVSRKDQNLMRRHAAESDEAHCMAEGCLGFKCRIMVPAGDDDGVPTMCGTRDRSSTCGEHGNVRYLCRECKEGGTGGRGICEHGNHSYVFHHSCVCV
jgi:hypothetical protein